MLRSVGVPAEQGEGADVVVPGGSVGVTAVFVDGRASHAEIGVGGVRARLVRRGVGHWSSAWGLADCCDGGRITD